MDQNELKRQVAKAALSFIDDDCILGVGTGSTVNCLIDALAQSGIRIEAAVSSSEESTRRLQKIGITVVDLNTAGLLDLYIDGADEFDANRYLIKGRWRFDPRKNYCRSRTALCLHCRSEQKSKGAG